ICLLIQASASVIAELQKHLASTYANVIEHRQWGVPWHMIEIIKSGNHKAAGLQKVADYYHIPKERIIAFGDGDNDLEMIEYAGYGIAMNNAIPELKAIANDITDTNEENGVATYLQQF